jgi:hypothetical protein
MPLKDVTAVLWQTSRKSGRDRPLDLLDSRDRPSKNYEG